MNITDYQKFRWEQESFKRKFAHLESVCKRQSNQHKSASSVARFSLSPPKRQQ